MLRFCSLSAVILLAAPLLLVNGQVTTTPECGANQHYESCGTACPANCSNYRDPIVCTEQCKPGCFCNDGYVFDSMFPNVCVEKNQCPIQKGNEYYCDKPNREYKACGSACPPTCANPQEGPCILVCFPGCFCKEGYLSNSNGDCVPESKCDDY